MAPTQNIFIQFSFKNLFCQNTINCKIKRQYLKQALYSNEKLLRETFNWKSNIKSKCYLQTQMKNFFFILYTNYSIEKQNCWNTIGKMLPYFLNARTEKYNKLKLYKKQREL